LLDILHVEPDTQLTDQTKLLISLARKRGGAGIRAASDFLLIARVASLHLTLPSAEGILAKFSLRDSPAEAASLLEAWSTFYRRGRDQLKAQDLWVEDDDEQPNSKLRKQHQMSEKKEKQLALNVQTADGYLDPGPLETAMRTNDKERIDTSGWLNHFGNPMTPGFNDKDVPIPVLRDAFRYTLNFFLGIPLNPTLSRCLVCNEPMTLMAEHALICKKKGQTQARANMIVRTIRSFAAKAELTTSLEVKVNGGKSNRRPGDLEIKSHDLEPILIDHTTVNVFAKNKWPKQVGQLACAREKQKYQSYKQHLRQPEELPRYPKNGNKFRLSHALNQATELWHNRVQFDQPADATAQTFWPVATELMGTHGPQMRILLDQLAQWQQNVMLGPKEKNLKYMRLVLSTITHEQIGLQLRRCCRLR